MSLLQSFIRRVERFMKRHGVTPSRFGKEAVNDPNFVFDLRSGRKPNVVLMESVERWMRAYTESGGREVACKKRDPPSPHARAAA